MAKVELRLTGIRNVILKDLFKLILQVMENEFLISEEEARILDILEQIKNLNAILKLHIAHAPNSLMTNQYTALKTDFLDELSSIFLNYDLQVARSPFQAA